MASTAVSKQVLAWSTTGVDNTVASVGRVQAAVNNAKKASETLNDELGNLRGLDIAKELGQYYGTLAGDITKADVAAQNLSTALFKVGATKTEIAAAATEFERFKKAQAELPTFDDAELGLGGAGGKKGQSLGSKIRSLPSVQIPGLGIGTDAIGNLLRILERVPPTAIPAIAAIAALTAAIAIVAKNVPDVTSGIRQITALDKAYYEARIKGTKDSIAAIIEQKQLEQKIAQARVNDLQFVAAGYDELHDKLGLLSKPIDALVEVAGALNATNFKDVRDARIAYDEAQASLKKANEDLALYNGLLDDQTVALNTADEALKKFANDVAQQTIGSIEESAKVQQEVNRLIAEGSQKELDAKKKELEAIQKNAEFQLTALKKNIDAAQEGSDAQKTYQEAFDKQSDIYNNATFELRQFSSAAVEAAVAFNDAQAELKKNTDESADLIIKYGEDRLKADDAAYQELAAIQDRYNNALVKAADDAAKAAEQALQKLTDQAAKLATGLQRDNEAAQRKAQDDALKAAVKFQEQEAKAARDHANNILKIKQDADNREQDLIASRDFAGLFRSRRDTQTQIQQATQQYQQEQSDRLAAFQQAQADRAQDYANQARERQIRYQQALEDARAQYNKELAQANVALIAANNAAVRARDSQLKIAQSKYDAEIALLNAHIQKSLQLYAQGLSAEEQLQQARTNALLQQISLLNGNFSAGAVNFGAAGSNTTNSSSSNASITNNFALNNGNITQQSIANIVSKVISGYLN